MVGRRARRRARWIPLACLGALGAVHFARPERPFLAAPHAVAAARADEAPRTPFAHLAAEAFGRSGGLRMQFALPGDAVALPLTFLRDSADVAYTWVPAAGGVASDSVAELPLAGAPLRAPQAPGFYRLALVHGDERHEVEDVTLTVMVPFEEKRGGMLHGFRLGTYVSERVGGARPDGFFQVEEEALSLPVSRHLRLRDVLTTPDTPRLGYPQYATVDVRLVEKLELVIDEVIRLAGLADDAPPRVHVNSGFRPPSYNETVRGAAKASRHQYGDAADVRIDVDADGRFSLAEVRLVARAVEAVERANPDLAGGLGIYVGDRLRSPYVHIDARGKRARWNGAG